LLSVLSTQGLHFELMMVFNRNLSQVFTSKCGPSVLSSSLRTSLEPEISSSIKFFSMYIMSVLTTQVLLDPQKVKLLFTDDLNLETDLVAFHLMLPTV